MFPLLLQSTLKCQKNVTLILVLYTGFALVMLFYHVLNTGFTKFDMIYGFFFLFLSSLDKVFCHRAHR